MLTATTALRIGDDHAGEAGHVINLSNHRVALDEIEELKAALHLGNDRVRMRIPGRNNLPRLDGFFITSRNDSTIRNLIALPLTTELINNGYLTRPRDGNQVTALVLHRFQVIKPDGTTGLDLNVINRGCSGSRTTNMEGAHRQLRAGLTN